jgi:hypothetical protein
MKQHWKTGTVFPMDIGIVLIGVEVMGSESQILHVCAQELYKRISMSF